MATVRDVGGRAKLKNLFAQIRDKAPQALTELGAVIAADAASRAPSVEEEYETLMWGEGNPGGFTRLAPMPASSGSSDGDHRLRLYKPPEDYLANWIAVDYEVQGLRVGVGNRLSLNRVSQYQWRNVDEQTHIESKYPLWQAWEIGGDFTIQALGVRKKSGTPYPLQPSLDHAENRDVLTMDKAIPRKQMFGGVDVASKVQQTLIPAIDKIVRAAQ